MARRKSQVIAPPTLPETDEGSRMFTPESGVPQALGQMQLVHWMTGMRSAPTVMQASKCVEDEIPKPAELDASTTTRKLTFSVQRANPSRPECTLADVVQGNRSQQHGLQLEYYPPIMKEGMKIVRLNQADVAEQTQK